MAESPQEQVQRMEMAVGSDLEWSPPLLLPVMVLVLVLVAPQYQATGLQMLHPL